MGREVKDWDVEVYGVEPARLRELLGRMGRVNVVGEAFTVYKLGQDLDVSLPRRERKTGRGHRAFYIEGDPAMSFEEAARRRDFTVNAILEDPLTGDIIDPYHGREDLERKLLRAVSPDTFVEDSLRVLRAAQFAARFELRHRSRRRSSFAARSTSPTSRPSASGARWRRYSSPPLDPRSASNGSAASTSRRSSSPKSKRSGACRRRRSGIPKGTSDVHTYLVCDRARELIDDLDYPRRVTVMLAALCHDFGKPSTTEFVEGRIRSRGHEEAGVAADR